MRRRAETDWSSEDLGAVRFVPLLPGVEAAATAPEASAAETPEP
jgi:hypothetical protein